MENNKRRSSNPRNVSAIMTEEMIGKVPPQATEIEEAVLGALMLEKDSYSIISDLLRPESFYKNEHTKIYKAISDLTMKQSPVDMHTVIEQLRRNGDLEESGGAYYVSLLTAKVASAAHIEYHARIIAQKHLARELIKISSDIQQLAFDDKTDVDELMQKAESDLFEVSQKYMKKDFSKITPVISEALKRIEAASKRTDGLSGIQSGFHKLDKLTSGWQRSDLVIIAARPAMGKTAFVLSMAKNMAVNYNTPVAVFSLEMANVQLVNRLIMNVCEIEGEKIKNGKLEPHEWQQLDNKLKLLQDAPIYLDDTPSLSIFELRTKARRLVREHNVQVIIIDYLQLMNAGTKTNNRENEVSMISRSLKGLAKELDIPIIALSQLNRGVENRPGGTGGEGKRPQLSDLRESGAIEQDADMVCFIHRPEYYKIDTDKDGNSLIGIGEIIVAKHRNGATDEVQLRFRGKYAKFENLEDQPEDDFILVGSKINTENNFYASQPTDVMPSVQGNNDMPF